MSLQDELDALRAEFVRSAPPGRAALYDAKVDELRRRDRSDSSQTTQGVAIRCGTGSSNPALSSRESSAKLTSSPSTARCKDQKTWETEGCRLLAIGARWWCGVVVSGNQTAASFRAIPYISGYAGVPRLEAS
jgi:hypothetical protein